MAIPRLTEDVAVIQKLSDLPNSADGLTADQLKAKFDESPGIIKKFLNEKLIPSILAKNIPFEPTDAISAEDIQSAIIQVQEQIRDAASGTIVNGSVTKEKLAAEVLARVYGGRPWVSVKTPDSSDNQSADFPIGQVWLRPAFDVANARITEWSASGCTVEAEEQKITLTGNNTTAIGKMTQSITGIGQEDDIIHILFDVAEVDSEITNLSMSVNGGAARAISGSVAVETQLMANGSLTLEISATWPSTSLADGNAVIENLAIVNVSRIVRQLTDCHDMADWKTYLQRLLPLDVYHSPAEVYMQVTNGNWWALGFEVLPVTRGGTGISELSKGQMLYANESNEMAALEAPTEADSVLMYDGETPVWRTKTKAIEALGQLRIMTGSYTGTSQDRTMELPCTPMLLVIYAASGPFVDFAGANYVLSDNPLVLANGAAASAETYVSYDDDGVTRVYPAAELKGNVLRFYMLQSRSDVTDATLLCNRSGKTYNWTAFY